MNARLIGIRDFLLRYFLIDLGARLAHSALGVDVVAAIVWLLFVLIGGPVRSKMDVDARPLTPGARAGDRMSRFDWRIG